jgi:hypothetical protein
MIFIIWLFIAVASGKISASKGRSFFGGFLLGVLLGPLGLAIACFSK